MCKYAINYNYYLIMKHTSMNVLSKTVEIIFYKRLKSLPIKQIYRNANSPSRLWDTIIKMQLFIDQCT